MKKQAPAFFAALLITLVVGMGMVVIGGNAAVNKNSVPVLDAPSQNSQAASGAPDPASSSQTQVEQLQALVAQYQAREQQYQDQLNSAQQQLSEAQSQLDQASETVQQYQRVLLILQRRGLIQIDQDGRIFLPRN